MRQTVNSYCWVFFLGVLLVGCQSATQLQTASADDAPEPDILQAMKSLPSPGPPALLTNLYWDCAFPGAADAARIDQAVASVSVAVSPNGNTEWVRVLEDPGYNFGVAAATCALGRRYIPARDAAGRPIWAVTPPIRVRFSR